MRESPRRGLRRGERDGEGAALALAEVGTKPDEDAIDQQVNGDRREHHSGQPRACP